MVNKKIGVRLIALIALATVLATACTQSYSAPPAATSTLIPPGLFVSPLPTGVDAMQLVADFGTQTAQAASGTLVTPAVTGTPGTASPVTDTPALSNGTFITPLSGTGTPVAVTFTPAPVTVVTSSGVTAAASTYVAPAGAPASYTLQQGEFPYCIARRYNLDPGELLRLNGLNDWDAQHLSAGLTLQLPQTGNPFPGTRALNPHPTSYTVTGGADTNLYAVACLYGDVFPDAIAQANSLSVSAVLTAGQQLSIP